LSLVTAWRTWVAGGLLPESVKPAVLQQRHIFCARRRAPKASASFCLEALASGLPVVATEVPGYMSCSSQGRDSVTVQPITGGELAASLVILARDADLRRRLSDYALQKRAATRGTWWRPRSSRSTTRRTKRCRPAGKAMEVTSGHHAV